MADNEEIGQAFQQTFQLIVKTRNTQLRQRETEEAAKLAEETYKAAPFHSQISELVQDDEQIQAEKENLNKRLEEITKSIKQCEMKSKENKMKIKEREMEAERAVAQLRFERATENQTLQSRRSKEDEETLKSLDHLMASYRLFVDFSPDYDELLKTLKLTARNTPLGDAPEEAGIRKKDTVPKITDALEEKKAPLPHNFQQDRTLLMKDVGDRDIPQEYPPGSRRWYIIECPVCQKSKFTWKEKPGHGVLIHLMRRHKEYFAHLATRDEAMRWCGILIQDATEQWVNERNQELDVADNVDVSSVAISEPLSDATPSSRSYGLKRYLPSPSSKRPEKKPNLSTSAAYSVNNERNDENPDLDSGSPSPDNSNLDLGFGIFRRLSSHKRGQEGEARSKTAQATSTGPQLPLKISIQKASSAQTILTPESDQSPSTGIDLDTAFDLLYLKCGTSLWKYPQSKISFKYNSTTNGFEPFEGGSCLKSLAPQLLIPLMDVDHASYASFEGQGNGLILEKRRKPGEQPWVDDGKIFQIGFEPANEADRFLSILMDKNPVVHLNLASDRQRIRDYEQKMKNGSSTGAASNRSTPLTSPDYIPDPPLIV